MIGTLEIISKRRKMNALVLVVLGVLTLTACIDRIPFEAEDKVPKLVIFGSFTQLSKDHEVSISFTGEFGKLGTPVRGAYVELADEEGNTAQYIEFQEGQYILPEGAMCGELGKTYQLSVTLQDESRYESTWEIMPETIQMEKPTFEINIRPIVSSVNVLVDNYFIDLLTDIPLRTSTGDKAFLRWEVEETYSIVDLQCSALDGSEICFLKVDNNFDNLNIFASIDDSQERLEKYRIYSRLIVPYQEFSWWHYFNVFQYAVSGSTYEYWSKIDIASNPTGSIFDKTPASVAGNITEIGGSSEVLGFFEVAAVTLQRVRTTRQELVEWIRFPKTCNVYIAPQNQPAFCCNCKSLPNNIPRPDYWGEE